MKTKSGKKCSLFLVLIMMCTFLSGSTVCAADGKGNLKAGSEWLTVTNGEEITLTASIPEEYKEAFNSFGGWVALLVTKEEHASLKEVDLGLNAEEMQQMEITFKVPEDIPSPTASTYLEIDYYYYIETVSGNHTPVWGKYSPDTSYLKPSTGAGRDESTESSSEKEEVSQKGELEVKNEVKLPDGKIITPSVSMYYEAKGIAGMVPAGTKDMITRAAGLTSADVEAGTNAKFYIGNVYKLAIKKSLQEAAAGINGNLITMINMDLYTIGKNGINAVRFPLEPVKMIIALPSGQVKDGRNFSLICIINGETVEVQDKDNNSNTVTIDAAYFGPYAVIWK